MQVTLVQGPSYILHQQQDVVVLSYNDLVCFHEASHCTVLRGLVCHCSVDVTRYLELITICIFMCFVLCSVAASFVLNVQHMG